MREATFHLPALIFGNVAILLQPARGYHLDATTSYHDPALVPPHAYIAAYLWLRHELGAHALIHNGKHGTLEWLPGKATALDAASYPDALWGQLPHLYPFIVNDPGRRHPSQAAHRRGHRGSPRATTHARKPMVPSRTSKPCSTNITPPPAWIAAG
ncbi:cobaltochelatase subunit CobN [Devosia sp. A8/3-2]|nr:cobaltochelatase subunit CobN [Devosia sp. A8/3-2]